jgi:hypothetical protein
MSASAKSKLTEVAGMALVAFGFLDSAQVLALMSPKVAAVIGAIGCVLKAYGVHIRPDPVP